MKRRTRFFRLALSLCWLVGLVGLGLMAASQPAQVHAQSGTTITLSPSAGSVVLNNTIAVDVLVTNYTNLYGADVRLTFDTSKLQVQDDNPFSSGIQVTPGPLLASDSFLNLFNTANNSAGTIQFVITQLAPTPPRTCACSGVLFTIHFKGIALGTGAVNFSFEKLADPNGTEIPATTTNGTVTVVNQPTAESVTAFHAERQGDDSAHVMWETGNELELVGFNVWRSTDVASGYVKRTVNTVNANSPGRPTGNTYEYADTALTPGASYYYKLEILHTGGSSEWTDPVPLSEACNAKPDSITQQTPANHAQVQRRVKLDWDDAACAAAYRVQVRLDNPKGATVKNKIITASGKTVRLERGHTYVWRVRSVGAQGRSAWSEWRAFTVQD